MSEVIDIRKELQRPLGRFRSAVHRLASGISLNAEDPDFGDVVDQTWLFEVKPALDEIDERIRHDTALMSLAGRFATQAIDPIRSALPAAALGGLTMTAGAGKWLAAAAGLAVAGASSALQVVQERRRALNDIEKAQYYFLYRTNRRVAP